ncbi:uncharacterized protein K460DRAFT_350992 [Cucurbitaria berberidis CBS 394.84]|uniref:GPI anchored protein n=1 Tax=Cucurbitaria berberidis CBS 394.84 TaxID=1168544 RepID=A0A9P4GSI9_9PLEO|nr:uncharacterized protein K460DRAFT_350992 [Cucurbitaria berberidis CBS 394.84]KAF1851012.1 hypothetical protein K460DRAFT_350992 [Cucurbitaria berberidis CBS 394.84]
MLFQKFALVSALAALVATQDISQDDIPQQCRAVCADIVSIAQRCDNENETDAAELACICRAPNANTLVPTCEACVAQFDRDDDQDDNPNDRNDVFEVLTRCNFTTTAHNSASASSVLQSIASSLVSASASASGSVAVTTSGTVVLTTRVPASTQVPQQTGAAMPAQTAGAAIGLGALGIALGML